MNILKYKNIYFIISGIAIFLSIISVAVFGFNLSIDFKGGSIYEISYQDKVPSLLEVKAAVQQVDLGLTTVQQLGTNNFVIKTSKLTSDLKDQLEIKLTIDNQFSFQEERVKLIGPSISSELGTRAIFAILLVTIVIILFITYVFRKVSQPISSFKYGFVAIITLLHDIIIPIGIFAILGAFFIDYQIDVLFVTALLAILGYSVNDTIVVFDRIRENLNKEKKPEEIKGKKFEEIIEKSLQQTIVRSVNTSVTTLIVLMSFYFLGGETTQPFALVLAIGVLVGTYSSIFLASPLLILIEKYQKEKKIVVKEEVDESTYL